MKLKNLLNLIKNKDKKADCFYYDPNSNTGFEIEQVQEICDGDGNIELVFSRFESQNKSENPNDEKDLYDSLCNLLGAFNNPVVKRKLNGLTDFQQEAINIAEKLENKLAEKYV